MGKWSILSTHNVAVHFQKIVKDSSRLPFKEETTVCHFLTLRNEHRVEKIPVAAQLLNRIVVCARFCAPVFIKVRNGKIQILILLST